jgi:hypothetical protein
VVNIPQNSRINLVLQNHGLIIRVLRRFSKDILSLNSLQTHNYIGAKFAVEKNVIYC